MRTKILLNNRLGEQIFVRLQDPVRMNNYSQPEPDISVVIPDPLYYEDHPPIPSEIYLIIEVADTTLRTDCGIKAKIYAESGITDYWVLDVNNRQLHVFREQSQDGYKSLVILADGDSISLLRFPDCSFFVREMLRPLVSI